MLYGSFTEITITVTIGEFQLCLTGNIFVLNNFELLISNSVKSTKSGMLKLPSDTATVLDFCNTVMTDGINLLLLNSLKRL